MSKPARIVRQYRFLDREKEGAAFFVDSSKRNGPCFGYVYSPDREYCDGYVFHFDEETDEVGSYYADFYNEHDVPEELGTACDANYGVGLRVPVRSNSTRGTETEAHGCRLSPIVFGVRTSQETCRASCLNCTQFLDAVDANVFACPLSAEQCLRRMCCVVLQSEQ